MIRKTKYSAHALDSLSAQLTRYPSLLDPHTSELPSHAYSANNVHLSSDTSGSADLRPSGRVSVEQNAYIEETGTVLDRLLYQQLYP